MTYEEINELIPHERSHARARRTSWKNDPGKCISYIQRPGSCPLFKTKSLPNGGIEQTPVYEHFCRVWEGEDVIAGYVTVVTWKPLKEDLAADDWILL